MDLQLFQEQAKSTMNFNLTAPVQLQNLALGIICELGEVSDAIQFPFERQKDQQEHFLDEGGDVLWYVVNLCSYIQCDWTSLFPTKTILNQTPTHYLLTAFRFAANIGDTIKKSVGQGHELDVTGIIENLQGLLAHLIAIFHAYDVRVEDVCEYNRKKLMKRYGGGFSAEASVNREV